MTIALPYLSVPYITPAAHRHLVRHGVTVWSAGLGALRRFSDRPRLTAQQRANSARR